MPVNSTVKAFLICDFCKVNKNVKLKGTDIDKTLVQSAVLLSHVVCPPVRL